MNNKQLNKALEQRNGFWVRLVGLKVEGELGPIAKILIAEGYLTLYTLQERAPAINIYNSKDFAFISTDTDTVLKVNGEGEIFDWWDYDDFKTPEDYTTSFLNTWNLSKEEYEKYTNEENASKLLRLKIQKVNQQSSPC